RTLPRTHRRPPSGRASCWLPHRSHRRSSFDSPRYACFRTTLRGMAAADISITKVCRGCGGTFPLDELAFHRNCTYNRAPRCLPCENARKRRSEQALADPESFPGIERAVDEAPDPAPARRLRAVLEDQR